MQKAVDEQEQKFIDYEAKKQRKYRRTEALDLLFRSISKEIRIPGSSGKKGTLTRKNVYVFQEIDRRAPKQNEKGVFLRLMAVL